MERIATTLKKKILIKNTSTRKINLNYELADLFASKYKLSTLFVLKLFKKHSPEKVLSLDSWLRDIKVDSRGYLKLLVWKLKQDDRVIIFKTGEEALDYLRREILDK